MWNPCLQRRHGDDIRHGDDVWLISTSNYQTGVAQCCFQIRRGGYAATVAGYLEGVVAGREPFGRDIHFREANIAGLEQDLSVQVCEFDDVWIKHLNLADPSRNE